jgi:hypothetical protein
MDKEALVDQFASCALPRIHELCGVYHLTKELRYFHPCWRLPHDPEPGEDMWRVCPSNSLSRDLCCGCLPTTHIASGLHYVNIVTWLRQFGVARMNVIPSVGE